MHIAFVIPSLLALGSPRSGVLAQARRQAEALRARDIQVTFTNPWEPLAPGQIDLVHFYQGGLGLVGVEKLAEYLGAPLVFSPIIDSNQSHGAYRAAAFAGSLVGPVLTVPGVLRHQALHSQLVICRSEHERRRVVEGLGVPEERTRIVLNGTTFLRPAPDPGSELHRLGIDFPYLFHLSIYSDPRKNVERLMQATENLGIRLVIAGAARPSQERERIHALGKRLGHVTFLGELSEVELAALYAGARAFCLPSLHEGTGLAALEAAALQTPVVVTECGGPRDYFGVHAQYVDPYRTESIRAAVTAALGQGRQDELALHVRNTATWEQSARQLEACYQAVLDSQP